MFNNIRHAVFHPVRNFLCPTCHFLHSSLLKFLLLIVSLEEPRCCYWTSLKLFGFCISYILVTYVIDFFYELDVSLVSNTATRTCSFATILVP